MSKTSTGPTGPQILSTVLLEGLKAECAKPGGLRRVAAVTGLAHQTVGSALAGLNVQASTIHVLTAFLSTSAVDELTILLEVREELRALRAWLAPIVAEFEASRVAA